MSILPGEITIKKFTMDDKAKVNAFFDQMGAETRAFFDRGDGNRNNALKFFDGTAKNTDYFMAEYNGEMVGYLFLWDMDKSVPWLGIAVSEGLKGLGLGRKLMLYSIDYAREHLKGGILLTTHIANMRGQALYERVGFERMGIHTTGEILYLIRI